MNVSFLISKPTEMTKNRHG